MQREKLPSANGSALGIQQGRELSKFWPEITQATTNTSLNQDAPSFLLDFAYNQKHPQHKYHLK